jgi:hypothetical protein
VGREIINHQGDVLPGDLQTLRELFRSNAPESILRAYAVKHAKFVLIDHHGKRANLFMEADDIALPTRVGLFIWLQHSAVKSIIIYDDPDSFMPVIQSRAKVLAWLQSWLLPAHRPCPTSFRSRVIDSEQSALAPLARAFLRVAAELRSVEAAESISNEMFQGRFTISSLASDDKTMVIQSLGHGYRSFDRTWTDMARGRRPQDGPDYHYGLWVGETHRHALLTNRVLFDDVDAVIARPMAPPMRVTYTRCVVPFRLPKGPCYVLSASAARDDIRLRS